MRIYLFIFWWMFCVAMGARAQNRVGGERGQDATTEQRNGSEQRLLQLSKAIDDLSWEQRILPFAYYDKVLLAGLPPAVIRNPTGQGAKNPVKFSAYVFLPKNLDVHKKYPLLVLPHDGVHGDFKTAYFHIIKELMAQGYVVVAPEYRGSTGYGEGFYRLIDYGGRENDDVKMAKDFMLESYHFIDKNRVGILGWSHGGMITLMNLFQFPKEYQVGFAGVPVSDLIARMGYKNQGYRALYEADYHLGKSAADNVDEYKKRSPVWNADKLEAPLLIHTNTNDEDVNVLEVEHLVKSLKVAGKKFEYEIFEDMPGGHVFDRLDTFTAVKIRFKIYRFLAQYLHPEKPFGGEEEVLSSSYYPEKK